MYKILIVDDEPWIVYGIKALVEWEELGFEVIGEAYNGIAALEAILEKKPDAVITDIRMPGLNGIELIEQLNQSGIETKVILVSGYAEFEYAHKALNLGAFGYLLKQIDKNSLIAMLQKLKIALDEKYVKNSKRDLFLDDLFEILKPDNKMTISEFITNKQLNLSFSSYRFISFSFSQNAVPLIEEEYSEVNGVKYICLRTGQKELSLLINYDEKDNPNGIENFLKNSYQYAEAVGISSKGQGETLITKLFQESKIAIYSSLFLADSRIMEYKITDINDILSKLLLGMEAAIRDQKLEQIQQILEGICSKCRKQQIHIDGISMIYNQIVNICKKYYPGIKGLGELEYLNFYQIVAYYSSIDQLFGDVRSFFEKKTGEDIYISNELVKKILIYIDERFTEDVSLGDISKGFNVSLGYLSALIKKETGKTYTEYITNKRLESAKELLKDDKLSIEEIVQRIGYKDYFYFNKLFKKYIGITPSKYRKVTI